MPVVLYEWRRNFDGTFALGYISPKLFEIFGIPSSGFDNVLQFSHPDDTPALLASIEQATRIGAPWHYEGRVTAPDQPLRWVRGNSVPTGRDATGVIYSGIMQDVTLLKLAEAALRESDLRLGLAVDGFGDGTWELNVASRRLSLSSDFKAVLGYGDNEFSNEPGAWHLYMHPEDVEQTSLALQAHLEGRTKTYASEHRLRCQNGTYKWVLARARITERDASGQPLLMAGLMADISKFKNTQRALDASTNRLSTVIANFQEGLVLEDENRHMVLTNEAFCRLLRVAVTPAQLIGKDGAWLTEGSRAYVTNPVQYVARIMALLHRREPVVGDVLALRDDRTLQRDFTPVFDGKRYIGYLWKYEDITVRIKAEEDLKRREEKYRGIIENMSLGLVEADLHDQLLYANQSFCDMTGYCIDDMKGRDLSPLLLTGEALALAESK